MSLNNTQKYNDKKQISDYEKVKEFLGRPLTINEKCNIRYFLYLIYLFEELGYDDSIRNEYLKAVKLLRHYEKIYESNINRTLILTIVATFLSCAIVISKTHADDSYIMSSILALVFATTGGVMGGIALKSLTKKYEHGKECLMDEIKETCPQFYMIENAKQKSLRYF